MNNSDDFDSPVRASWDANQTVPVLRPPRECASTQLSTGSSSDATLSGGSDAPKAFSFRLSADAKEFVPRSAQASQPPATSEATTTSTSTGRVPAQSSRHLPQEQYYPNQKVSLQNRLDRFQHTNGTDRNHEETHYNSELHHNNENTANFIQLVVQRYNKYIQEIIVKPGRFDALATMLLEESISWFEDSQAAYTIMDLIVSQAIIERNFQYNGARLCSLLSAELDNSDEPVFKNQLFERIKVEYNKILPDIEKQPSRAFGFVGFLGELYTQMGHADSSNDLGEYFLNIVDGLVSSLSVESIKRVCQLLKLTGGMLDKENKAKMEVVMGKLEKAGYKTNTTHLVGSVIRLRDQNWGEEVGHDPKDALIDSSLSALPCLQSEAVQYGPDGLALSKEESEFLHTSLHVSEVEHSRSRLHPPEVEDADDFGDEYAPLDEDEMDEEMEKGFLEFLIESKQIM